LQTLARAHLDVLREQDEWFSANRDAISAKIHHGNAELDRGEGAPEDELDAQLKTQPD